MKISVIPFPLCLSKSSSGQEVLVRTLADLRAKSSANLIGLLHCYRSGELQRWLMSIGQNDASRMVAQINAKQCIRTILVVLKKHLQLPVGDGAIDLTCRKLEAPLTFIGWRSLAKFSNIRSKNDLGVFYECWKSGVLARKLVDIGRNDLADEISKIPFGEEARNLLFKLREIFGLSIKTSLIDEFCVAMVPPLNLASNTSGKKKLVRTIPELRKMSSDYLRGLYECWKSGELARWLADIGQGKIATKLTKKERFGWGRNALCRLRSALNLPFSNSDLDNYLQLQADGQSSDDDDKKTIKAATNKANQTEGGCSLPPNKDNEINAGSLVPLNPRFDGLHSINPLLVNHNNNKMNYGMNYDLNYNPYQNNYDSSCNPYLHEQKSDCQEMTRHGQNDPLIVKACRHYFKGEIDTKTLLWCTVADAIGRRLKG